MSNEETPVVNQVSDMLRYQTGSVVSRVLLKNKGGTVTLFAFSKGEGLSEHTAPFDALVHVIEGEAEIGIGPSELHARNGSVSGEAEIGATLQNFQVRAGELITLPANRPHAVAATTDFKMLLIMIRA